MCAPMRGLCFGLNKGCTRLSLQPMNTHSCFRHNPTIASIMRTISDETTSRTNTTMSRYPKLLNRSANTAFPRPPSASIVNPIRGILVDLARCKSLLTIGIASVQDRRHFGRHLNVLLEIGFTDMTIPKFNALN